MILQTPHELLNRADTALAKMEAAERSGDPYAIAEARRVGLLTKMELERHVATDDALAKIKAAQGVRKAMFAGGSTDKWPYSEESRRVMSQTGEAMPDGGFPVRTVADVEQAFAAWQVPGPHQTQAAKKHILRRATELGSLHMLPDDWRGDTQASGKAAAADLLRKQR